MPALPPCSGWRSVYDRSMSLLEEFQWRGMVYDTTEGLADVLAAGALTAYIGFDPTAAIPASATTRIASELAPPGR